MGKVRFGILGCANVARKAFLPALLSSNCAYPIAVASRTKAKAQEYAALFSCEAVEGYDNLLIRDDIDAVYIATPIGLHAQLAIKAAESGKHVLCEKTLARNVEESQLIYEACKRNNVALLEGFSYQFHPQHQEVRDIIEKGQIGNPILFQAWFGFPPLQSQHRYDSALGGGALLDAGTYTVHSARRFFGREPLRVWASLDDGDQPVEIHGSVILDFGGGQTALLAFGFDNMYRNSYSIWGTKGQVTLNRAFSVPANFAPTIILEKQGRQEERTVAPYDQFKGEIEVFCAGLNDPDRRRAWREDALAQAKVLASVFRCARAET